jgi:hypothetical protein
MSTPDSFAQICRDVCESESWELLPSGVNVPLEDSRHQVIALEFFELDGRGMVRMLTQIGSANGLSGERLIQILRSNCTLAHGAMAIQGDNLCMTDTLILDDADPSEVQSAIWYIAQMADYYEKILFGTDDY